LILSKFKFCMGEPWISISPSQPPLVCFSIPPSIQLSHCPGVVTLINLTSRGPPQRLGLNLLSLHNGFALTRLNTSETFIPHSSLEPEVGYPLQGQSVKGFLFRLAFMLSDVLCFIAEDLQSTYKNTITFARKCSKLCCANRPAISIIISKVPSRRYKHLENMLQTYNLFYSIETYVCERRLPNGVLEQANTVLRNRAERKHMWNWFTLCQLSHGIVKSSSEKRSPFNSSYVSILDITRQPRSLQSIQQWLSIEWGRLLHSVDSGKTPEAKIFPLLAQYFIYDYNRLGHSKFQNHNIEPKDVMVIVTACRI
jgi:hypothetical protein